MYKITFYYWFESPYMGRATGDISINCRDNFEVAPTIRQTLQAGVIMPISPGLRRFIAPHQIIDTVIEEVIEEVKDAKIKEADPARDEGVSVKVSRPRKSKDSPLN